MYQADHKPLAVQNTSIAVAAIIRITGGNFRLLERLLTQTERLLDINALPAVTRQVVEAARESLVSGTNWCLPASAA